MRPFADYVTDMKSALKSPGAHMLYFPAGLAARRQGNMRLAREIAPALDNFPPAEVRQELGTLYGAFIVSHSLDLTGVAVDAKEWLTAVKENMKVKI